MDVKEIEKRFTYHPPKEGQPEIYQSIRGAARSLALQINEACPDGREKALALTRLEEVVMQLIGGVMSVWWVDKDTGAVIPKPIHSFSSPYPS